MKKFFLFASAALVLASCSSEAEEAVIKPNETPEEEVLELTEIKLGAGAPTVSAETRAAVEVNDWSNTPVGIFGVNENASAQENNWSVAPDRNDMEITVENAVILLNEPATVATPSTGGAVTFTNANANKIYFPRGNSKNYGYTFLGYYPYIEGTTTASADTIKVTGKFDGTQDIMAGKAASASGSYNNGIGYNAKYIRECRAQESNEPNINIAFEHLTSKIDILLKQEPTNYIQEMCDVYAAWFEVEEDYTLTFAKPTSGNGVNTSLAFAGDTVKAFAIGGDDFKSTKSYKSGDIVRYTDGLGNTVYKKFKASHTGDWTGNDVDNFDPIAPETSPSTTHTIFVTPDPQQENSGTAYKTLHLVLNDDPSKDISVKVASPAGGFEAGKAYTVTVTINGPEAITVTASITPWQVVGGTPGVEI